MNDIFGLHPTLTSEGGALLGTRKIYSGETIRYGAKWIPSTADTNQRLGKCILLVNSLINGDLHTSFLILRKYSPQV